MRRRRVVVVSSCRRRKRRKTGTVGRGQTSSFAVVISKAWPRSVVRVGSAALSKRSSSFCQLMHVGRRVERLHATIMPELKVIVVRWRMTASEAPANGQQACWSDPEAIVPPSLSRRHTSSSGSRATAKGHTYGKGSLWRLYLMLCARPQPRGENAARMAESTLFSQPVFLFSQPVLWRRPMPRPRVSSPFISLLPEHLHFRSASVRIPIKSLHSFLRSSSQRCRACGVEPGVAVEESPSFCPPTELAVWCHNRRSHGASHVASAPPATGGVVGWLSRVVADRLSGESKDRGHHQPSRPCFLPRPSSGCR